MTLIQSVGKQVWSTITEVPELQDVQGPKRVAPSPTAQTHEPK